MHGTLTGRHTGGPMRRITLARVRGLFWHYDEFRLYRYRLAELPALVGGEGSVVRRDHLSDLDLYEPSAPWWLPKETFLATARGRLAAGEHVYTVATRDRLLHYAWLADWRQFTFVQEVGQTFHFVIPGAVLYDAYTVPEARNGGFQTKSIQARLHDAETVAGARWAYVGCLAANRASRTVIERSGFAYYTSLYRVKTLGVASRWQGTARA